MSDTKTRVRKRQESDGYRIREFEPSDLGEFFSLYSDVFEKRRGPEWFRWRYGGPYFEQVPMAVAEHDGELVGAEPFIAFPMRAGKRDLLALQPADAMVHADHRRQGLLTRMTEFALDRYRTDADLLFNFPNRAAKGAFIDLGWTDLGEMATYYRIQDLETLLGQSAHTGLTRAAMPVLGTLTRGHLAVRDAMAGTGTDVTVSRHRSLPAETLAELYDEDRPQAIHARRDVGFYRWRFANPEWTCRTYLAERDGTPAAALVVTTQQNGDVTTTKLMDALPMTGRDRYEGEFSALVATALSDHADSDVVSVGEGTLPHSVLSEFGFVRDDAPPLSWRSTVTQLVARPLGERRAFTNLNPLDREHWAITLAEQDTSH